MTAQRRRLQTLAPTTNSRSVAATSLMRVMRVMRSTGGGRALNWPAYQTPGWSARRRECLQRAAANTVSCGSTSKTKSTRELRNRAIAHRSRECSVIGSGHSGNGPNDNQLTRSISAIVSATGRIGLSVHIIAYTRDYVTSQLSVMRRRF